MRFKINFKIFLFTSVISILSCSKEESTKNQTNVNESSGTELIDFKDNDISNIIKMNFSKEFGGIEKEREVINEMVLTDMLCNVDTNIVKELVTPNNDYFLSLTGNLKNRCESNFMVYNDHFIYFTTKNAKGNSKAGNFEIAFDMNTTINIGGNINDNVYKYSGIAYRNLTFLKGLNSNQEIGGVIKFISNFCPFDFKGNKHSDKIEYEVNLSLYNQKIISDKLKVTATIKRESSNWVLKLDNGATYLFN